MRLTRLFTHTAALSALLLPSLAQGQEINQATKDYWDGNYVRAIPILEKMVAAGNNDARAYLGYMLIDGNGVAKDVKKGMELCATSMEAGNSNGISCSAYGILVTTSSSEDKSRAINMLLSQRFKSPIAYTEYFYSQFYDNISSDSSEASGLIENSPKVSKSYAYYMRAMLYSKEKNYQKAIEYYKMAIDNGSLMAKVKLGILYRDGNGVNKDIAKANDLFLASGDSGYPTAYRVLADYYLSNKDYSMAIRLLEKSASFGNKIAINQLGVIYSDGLGVARDRKRAVEYYKEAARQGLPVAAYNAAITLWNIDTLDSIPQAVEYIHLAEQLGYDPQATSSAKEGIESRMRLINTFSRINNMLNTGTSNVPLGDAVKEFVATFFTSPAKETTSPLNWKYSIRLYKSADDRNRKDTYIIEAENLNNGKQIKEYLEVRWCKQGFFDCQTLDDNTVVDISGFTDNCVKFKDKNYYSCYPGHKEFGDVQSAINFVTEQYLRSK